MGKVAKPWTTAGQLTIVEPILKNTITLPTYGAFSIFFSTISIIKAMIGFNIIQVHVDKIVDSKKFFKKFVGCFICHLPFLATGAYFRIAFCTISYTYLGNFAILPIGLFWIANLIIGYRHFNRNRNPLWLISFVSIFFPVCLSMKLIDQRYVMSPRYSNHKSLSC